MVAFSQETFQTKMDQILQIFTHQQTSLNGSNGELFVSMYFLKRNMTLKTNLWAGWGLYAKSKVLGYNSLIHL